MQSVTGEYDITSLSADKISAIKPYLTSSELFITIHSTTIIEMGREIQAVEIHIDGTNNGDDPPYFPSLWETIKYKNYNFLENDLTWIWLHFDTVKITIL